MLISITDIIVQSIALYKNNAKRFAMYAVLIFIPGACLIILSTILQIFIPNSLTIGVLGFSYILYILFAIALSFVGFWISLAFIRVLAKSYAGQAVSSISGELKDAKVVFWPAVAASALSALAVLGGMFLLIVPGVIFGIWFVFSVYSTTIDNTSPMEAMTKSKMLVDGRWWEVFWRLLIPSITFAIVIVFIQYIVELPLEYVLQNTDPRSLLFVSWGTIAELIAGLTTLLLAPLTTAIPAILYIELKKHPLPKKIPPETV